MIDDPSREVYNSKIRFMNYGFESERSIIGASCLDVEIVGTSRDIGLIDNVVGHLYFQRFYKELEYKAL